MVKGKKAKLIRKAHRYLGLFLGIQFIFWTVSGLYFSWTDIDDIHGDQFLKEVPAVSYTGLPGLDSLGYGEKVHSLQLVTVVDKPYYWINDSVLIDAATGVVKQGISEEEAIAVANLHLKDSFEIIDVERIESTGKHHEFRGRPLPAYAILYRHPEGLTAYVDARNGSFQRIRHDAWRWFDFLWMFHTMDYEGRDDFNNTLLRAFSLLGLITVLSGFTLWFVSSPTIRKLLRKRR